MSYLYLRDDFPQLIEQAAEFHRIPNAAIVEKDYYVTEALRLVADGFGDQIIFKGGTSLSKGWRLIGRFSEDIDLYINPGDRGTNARGKLLKAVEQTIGAHPALTLDERRTRSIKGIARSSTFSFVSQGSWEGISQTVILEAGIQSGVFPTESRPISSLLAEFLISRNADQESKDFRPFNLPLLHFRRTLMEKLYALHDKVERGMIQDGIPVGTYARHYYDGSQLLMQPEVQAMLKEGSETIEIAKDYRRLTKLYFSRQLLPRRMNLDQSQALFPEEALREALSKDYTEQCESLCYGPFPAFEDVLAQFQQVRDLLRPELEDED